MYPGGSLKSQTAEQSEAPRRTPRPLHLCNPTDLKAPTTPTPPKRPRRQIAMINEIPKEAVVWAGTSQPRRTAAATGVGRPGPLQGGS